MKTLTALLLCTLLGATTLSSSASAQCCGATKEASVKDNGMKSNGALPDVVATAIAADGFDTLVAAVKAAGLVEALQGEGPFTIFAPTDAAFAKLPKGTLETLLKPENKAMLTSILTYHVVAGKFDAKSVVKMSGATTLNGQRAAISVDDHGVTVGGARVVKTDVMCGNGIIHVIDSVILPTEKNIVATAKGVGKFKTLLAAATAAGLADALQGDGPFTVFAPTDAAFAKLPEGTVESLLKPENKHKLVKILKFHVVPGRVFSDGAAKAGKATTLADLPVSFSKASSLQVNGVNIVGADVNASNGVIHVIDAVLLP